MERIKAFELEESPYQKGYYTIRPKIDKMPITGTNGSFALLGARLMELSYANYCRFCRDQLGALIIGKNTLYPKIYLKKNPITLEFIRTLNARATLLIN